MSDRDVPPSQQLACALWKCHYTATQGEGDGSITWWTNQPIEREWWIKTAEFFQDALTLHPELLPELARLTEQLQGERLVHALQEQRWRAKHGKAPRFEDDQVAHTLGMVTPDRCRECGEHNPEVARLQAELAAERAGWNRLDAAVMEAGSDDA